MSILLEKLTKSYAGLVVVDRVSLDIPDGELFVLLGTSGSGKSTILRLIAGLTEPDSGRIVLHGRDATHEPAQQRGTGFVFQNYSIFKHMSVAENIEFGLRLRKKPPAERAQRRDQLLDLVNMVGLSARYPNQLSGGQQQRVALARALAYEPGVLLLDEPFGALDVRTRHQLRRSLKEVQRKLKVTAVLVTHDQDEAFQLGDRIGVLDRGRLLEVATPQNLYAKPETLFAATFVGAGTVLVGRVDKDRAQLGTLVLPIPPEVPHEDGAPVQVLFRPEQVNVSVERPSGTATVLGRGSIVDQTFTGAFRRLRLRLPRLPGTRQMAPAVPFGEEGLITEAAIPFETLLPDQEIWVTLNGWHILRQPEPQLLVYTAGDQARTALTLARMMAQQMNGSVTLLDVAENDAESEKSRLQLVQQQQESGLSRAHVLVRTGNPGEQLVAEQGEKLYSLILLAPGGSADSKTAKKQTEPRLRARARGLGILEPTIMKLLERLTVPLLAVKGEQPSLRKLLICTAAGEPGKSDVREGGHLARRLGASATLLYVERTSRPPNPLAAAHLQRAASTLRALEVEVETRVVQAGDLAQAILGEAQNGDYDLIVIGNHRPPWRSVFSRDDITLQVLADAGRSVMVVPAEET